MKNEYLRIHKLLQFEKQLWASGLKYVAGVDEAGRGPLAGPVVAAAVIFPKNIFIPRVNDSKKLTTQQRNTLFEQIHSKAIAIGVGIIDHKVIDEINILQATFKAMLISVANLKILPDHILVDGKMSPNFKQNHTTIIKGDLNCFSIAAASIIAKVTRDEIMLKSNEKYPYYGFDKHKGYPTKQHITAIRQYGYCPIHRLSFKIKALLDE